MTDFGRRAGDMDKSTYDADKDGTVDNAEKLQGSTKAEVQDHTPKSHAHAQGDVTNLATSLAGKAAASHTHPEAEIVDLDHDAQKIKGVTVDDTNKGDTRILAYDLASTSIKYIDQPSG